ncbi:hypothetical protein SEA_LITTLEFELLA_42 [Gordonia phage LittleFella]|nr:hypothetical protein SEA_LITTLEFELLA_42 [Gordonia phage LittleFella]
MKVITKICPLTGQEHGMEFTDDVAKRIEEWEAQRNANSPFYPLIQNAFPDLSAEEREFILTGSHPKAFDELFGGEDDE